MDSTAACTTCFTPKDRLVNPRVINAFYPSLKVRVKVVSVNIKSGTMNVISLALSKTKYQVTYSAEFNSLMQEMKLVKEMGLTSWILNPVVYDLLS